MTEAEEFDPIKPIKDSSTEPSKTESKVNETPARVTPPSYQAVQRDDNNASEVKSCRICLEDEGDSSEEMIAPCKCKGSSKWVHRQCLDQWRTNETDRAFAQCTECLFQYHLQAVQENGNSSNSRRKRQYCMLVTRDLCQTLVVSQILIAFLGGISSLIDSDRSIPKLINAENEIGVYYLFGLFLLLIALGIFGVATLCQNGCSPSQSLARYQVRTTYGNDEPGQNASQPTYADRSAHYQQQRQRYQARNPPRGHRNGQCCHDCCLACSYSCHPSPYYYYGHPGSVCWGCDACCNGASASGAAAASGGGSGCDCGGGDCGGDAVGVLVIILLVLAAALAAAGFVVGICVVVVLFQRSLQRHIYLLHKQQLAQEFQVLDLSGYNLDEPLPDDAVPKRPQAADNESTFSVPPVSPLSENDSLYLKNLGLMV